MDAKQLAFHCVCFKDLGHLMNKSNTKMQLLAKLELLHVFLFLGCLILVAAFAFWEKNHEHAQPEPVSWVFLR